VNHQSNFSGQTNFKNKKAQKAISNKKCVERKRFVPESQAALAYLITALHLCAFLMQLARKLCGGLKQKQPFP